MIFRFPLATTLTVFIVTISIASPIAAKMHDQRKKLRSLMPLASLKKLIISVLPGP